MLEFFSKFNILFIGPDATSGCYTHGSGSGSVVTNDVVCPLQAFTNFFGDDYAKEYFTYFDGKGLWS